MPNLSTSFLGLSLPSPVVLGSSSLSRSVDGVKRAEDAGAGAVVLKSLFEEQISAEVGAKAAETNLGVHPEAEEYVSGMGMRLGPEDYLSLIRSTREAVSIPVIASVNCVSPKWWGTYAKQLEDAGAQAIEVNIGLLPRGVDEAGDSIDTRTVKIVSRVRSQVNVPLAVKIGPYYSSLANVTREIRKAGAQGLVLFNRFYQLDIDTENLQLKPGVQFSAPEEIYPTLRWLSLLYGRIGCDLAATTGIHNGEAAIKALLAGAGVVQMCTGVYRGGYEALTETRDSIAAWMDRHSVQTIAEMSGQLSQDKADKPELYERLQYIRALTGLS